MFRLLPSSAFLLLFLLSTAAGADPQEPLDEERRAANREIAFLEKFRNFNQYRILAMPHEQLVNELIRERQSDPNDERKFDWMESLLIQKTGVEGAAAIREAMQEARALVATMPPTSDTPTLFEALLTTLSPLPSLSKSVIIVAWRRALQEVQTENEELRNALKDYKDYQNMNKVIEGLLSEGVAADPIKFKKAVKVAERRFTNSKYSYNRDGEHGTRILLTMDDETLVDGVYNWLSGQFKKRYNYQYIIKAASDIIEEKKLELSVEDYKNIDTDKEMTGLLIMYLTKQQKPNNVKKITSKIKKAMEDARKIVTLQNAICHHKIRALRKLLQDNGEYERYSYRSLVELATKKNDFDSLKVLLEFSKFPKDFGWALLAAVQNRVDLRASQRVSKTPHALEKNLEIITFLINDKRTTLRGIDRMIIPFHSGVTLQEIKELRALKQAKEEKELKDLKKLKSFKELKELQKLKGEIDKDEDEVEDEDEGVIAYLKELLISVFS